ncbi:unnamed protein product [Malus baccata var. baccata]
MKTASSTSQEKKTTRLPPRRGKIKAEVFENIVKALVIMASKPAGREKNREEGEKKNATFPPRRGQIKANIFESLVKAVTNMTSKSGAQGKNRGEGNGGGGSASTTSPPSAYSSDANSDM